MFYHEIKDKV